MVFRVLGINSINKLSKIVMMIIFAQVVVLDSQNSGWFLNPSLTNNSPIPLNPCNFFDFDSNMNELLVVLKMMLNPIQQWKDHRDRCSLWLFRNKVLLLDEILQNLLYLFNMKIYMFLVHFVPCNLFLPYVIDRCGKIKVASGKFWSISPRHNHFISK